MRKVYLMTILILIANYIFFVDKFQTEIETYKLEIEAMNKMQEEYVQEDLTKDILELTGLEIIETMESEILRNNLISVNKVYSQSQDNNGYKIHEISFVLDGNEKTFREFIKNDIFQEEYNLQEINIYKDEEKELMKVIILVRTL